MKQKKNDTNIHKNHRDRMKETFLSFGFDAFSDVQKLEFMLFFSIPREDVNPLAHRLSEKYHTIERVLAANYQDLLKMKGVGKHTATLLKTFGEVRQLNTVDENSLIFVNTDYSLSYFYKILRYAPVEEFYVLCLNSANKVLKIKRLNMGSSHKVTVHIRDITQLAMSMGATKIVVAHNHPDGQDTFSPDDLHFTNNIIVNCLLNNIELIDHILVTPDKAISLRETGLLISLVDHALSKLNMKRTIPYDPSCPYVEYIVSNPAKEVPPLPPSFFL